MAWRFFHYKQVVESLRAVHGDDTQAIRDVEEAMENVLEDPDNPPIIISYPVRGRARDHLGPRLSALHGPRIAELPHDWILTYEAVDSMPPASEPVVIVLAFVRRASL